MWKTGTPVCENAITVQGSCAPWVKISETTAVTGTSSHDHKCQQGTASLFLQRRSDTRNKPLPIAKLSQQSKKNTRNEPMSTFAFQILFNLILAPLMCGKTLNHSALPSLSNLVILFNVCLEKIPTKHGLYFSGLEISMPKGKIPKKTEPPSSIAGRLSSPNPALAKNSLHVLSFCFFLQRLQEPPPCNTGLKVSL